jgi:hypothetical protein
MVSQVTPHIHIALALTLTTHLIWPGHLASINCPIMENSKALTDKCLLDPSAEMVDPTNICKICGFEYGVEEAEKLQTTKDEHASKHDDLPSWTEVVNNFVNGVITKTSHTIRLNY